MKERNLSDAQQRLATLMSDTVAGRISPANAKHAAKAIFDEALAASQKQKAKAPKPKNAGQIIKRGNNKWLVRLFLGRNSDGKRQYQNQYIHGTRKDAQKWLNGAL